MDDSWAKFRNGLSVGSIHNAVTFSEETYTNTTIITTRRVFLGPAGGENRTSPVTGDGGACVQRQRCAGVRQP